MAKTILIGGFGSGISRAIAEKFGKEGFAVGLIARNAARLEDAARALAALGIKAAALPGDLSNPVAIKAVAARARETLGPISVVQWNAYQSGAGDILSADPTEIRGVLDVAVTGLTALVQETLADLRANKGAVLVTNGGLGLLDSQ